MAFKLWSPAFAPGGEIPITRPIVLLIPLTGSAARGAHADRPLAFHRPSCWVRGHLRLRLLYREAVPRVGLELGSGYAGCAPGHHQHSAQQEHVDHLLGSL